MNNPVQSRFLEIDGLRGIAALGVAFYHIHPYGTFWMRSFVDLFFVISGFFITGVLLQLDVWSFRNVRNFWIRRILRIWPVYFVTLAGVSILWLAWSYYQGMPLRAFYGFWESIFFVQYIFGNYATLPEGANYLWWFGHSWSLAVEEQFYLLWPLALYKLRARPVACVFVLLTAIIIVLFFRKYTEIADYLLLTRGTGLLLGAILSVLHTKSSWGEAMYEARAMTRVAALVLMFLALVIVLPYLLEGYASLPLRVEIVDPFISAKFAFVYAVLLWILVNNLFPILNRMLCWSPLLYFGKISYAVYMFHLPLAEGLDKLYDAHIVTSRLAVEVVFWIVLIGAAELSRRFLEEPFGRMKERFPLTVFGRAAVPLISVNKGV